MTTLADLYAQVPQLDCRGKCRDSCGPIIVSQAERATLAARGIDLPTLDDARRNVALARLGHDDMIRMCPALGAFGQALSMRRFRLDAIAKEWTGHDGATLCGRRLELDELWTPHIPEPRDPLCPACFQPRNVLPNL